jgi:hypothetical protein
MVRIAALKLTDTARAFFNASPELHGRKVTWAEFKAVLHHRFRDPRTDQFQFSRLQTAKKTKVESVFEFADRCRALAHNVTPQVEDPAAQPLYNEQTDRMLLASNTSGLTGNQGKQVRYSLPTTLEDAIKIAVTVEQAEAHEQKDDTFSLSGKTKGPYNSTIRAHSSERGKSSTRRSRDGKISRGFEE